MKILWHSNAPHVPTGYGSQTKQVIHRLRDAGHDVAVSAFFGVEGGIVELDGFVHYPTDHTRRGKYALRQYARDHAGTGGSVDDVQIITLMDLWPWVDTRHGSIADFEGLRIASWVPIDHDPVPPRVCQAIDAFKVKPIAMSRFGEQQLRDNDFDPLYVPHAIDTEVFKPVEDRDALREAMGLDKDRFVIGMVANNFGCMPPRKAFPQMFQAFAEFRRRHDDAFLYLHCDILGIYEGINLVELAQINGIPTGSYGGVPQEKYMVGAITQEQMARVYSLMDVLANPSYGEGFGIPIVEAQACGVPVIVTDWTAMPELCGAGWTVQGDRWFNSPQTSFFKCPAVYEIVDALEKAYEARGDTVLRERAREFALGYDADRVFAEHWVPALEVLDRPREVGPLPVLNREQRRAAIKGRKRASTEAAA